MPNAACVTLPSKSTITTSSRAPMTNPMNRCTMEEYTDFMWATLWITQAADAIGIIIVAYNAHNMWKRSNWILLLGFIISKGVTFEAFSSLWLLTITIMLMISSMKPPHFFIYTIMVLWFYACLWFKWFLVCQFCCAMLIAA